MKAIRTWFGLLFSLNRITSLSVHFNSLGNAQYKSLEFIRKGDEIQTKGNLSQHDNTDELIKTIDSKNGIVLTVTGKGVLNKTTSIEKEGESLVKSVYPQINVDDFYYQIDRLDEGHLVSIIRKSQLESLMKESLIQNQVVFLYIGVATFNNIFKNDVQLENYLMHYENGNLIRISEQVEKSNGEIRFGNEQLKGNEAVLHISAYCSFIKRQPFYSSEETENTHNYNQKIESSFINKGGLMAISITLIMVLSNFMYFTSLNKSFNKLSLQKLSVEKEMRLLKKEEAQMEAQKELFEKLNFKKQTHHSELVDKISSKATEDIQFSALEIYPERKQNRSSETIAFHNSTLIVKGRAKSSNGFKVFTQSLSQIPLLETVKMTQFSKNQKLGGYDFKLFVTIND